MREGELVGGRYRLGAPIGHGGMGQVFHARDERLRRDVAIKVVDLSQSLDASVGVRFHREALATAQLNHSGIVTIFDADTDGQLAYLVMELLPGETLSELLRAEGPFSEARAVVVARRIADALVATHAIGVVHRDIKPANIMVDGDSVKLLDFGIALAQQDADIHLTAPATTLGTAAYMSPEQAQGLRATSASDAYALGGVLMTMLTCEPPYSGDNAIQVANRHLTHPVPDVRARRPDVSEGLADLVTRMLDKDPTARPSAAFISTALSHLEINPGAATTALLPAAAVATATLPVVAESVRPEPTLSLPQSASVAQATRIEPVPVRRGEWTPAVPQGAPPMTATVPLGLATQQTTPLVGIATMAARTAEVAPDTRVLPLQGDMPFGYAFGPEGDLTSARGDGGAVEPRPVGGQPDNGKFRTAATWIGVLLGAASLFVLMWGIGGRLIAPAVANIPEPLATPIATGTPKLTTSPTPSTPALGDAVKRATLVATVKGVDAVLGSDTPAMEKLQEQWESASEDIIDGKKAEQALAKFSDRVDAAAKKDELSFVEWQAIKFALAGVRAAL